MNFCQFKYYFCSLLNGLKRSELFDLFAKLCCVPLSLVALLGDAPPEADTATSGDGAEFDSVPTQQHYLGPSQVLERSLVGKMVLYFRARGTLNLFTLEICCSYKVR